jgi:hypothetical protein
MKKILSLGFIALGFTLAFAIAIWIFIGLPAYFWLDIGPIELLYDLHNSSYECSTLRPKGGTWVERTVGVFSCEFKFSKFFSTILRSFLGAAIGWIAFFIFVQLVVGLFFKNS